MVLRDPLSCCHGARVSELIQIKVEHVRLGYLDLYSKGGKLRRIYIPKSLQEEALAWLAEKKQDSGFYLPQSAWTAYHHKGHFG